MRAAAAKHPGEQGLEMPVHFREDRQQALASFAVDRPDPAAQPVDGRRQFGVLAGDGLGCFARFLEFGFGPQIDRAQVFALAEQAGKAAAGRGLGLFGKIGRIGSALCPAFGRFAVGQEALTGGDGLLGAFGQACDGFPACRQCEVGVAALLLRFQSRSPAASSRARAAS